MPGLVLVTAPAAEPLSLVEAKLYLRQDDTADDALIQSLIVAARQRAESRTGIPYVTQTWERSLDAFPEDGEAIELLPRLASVTSVKYTKSDDSLLTLSASAYYVDTVSQPGRVLPVVNTVWPSDPLRISNGVVIRFVAGYGADIDVPESVKGPLRELVAHYYEHREVTPEIPPGIEAALWDASVRAYA